MSEEGEKGGFRTRGEEALGELAEALLENPLFSGALSRAFGAGERAVQAQRSALGALNVATASEIERLTQRLRSLSNRLEAIEDRVDELGDALAAVRRQARTSAGPGPGEREGSAGSEGGGR